MPELILRQRKIAREGARFAVPVLLAASLTAACWAQGSECQCTQCPPLTQGDVLIGYLADQPTNPPAKLQSVDVLFDLVGGGGIPQEEYTLKLFELDDGVESAPLALENPLLLGEQTFVVENEPAGAAPTARWELVVLQTPVWTGPGNPLIAIDTTPEQMQDGVAPLLFAQATSWEEVRTYFSVDGGSCWCPLGDVDLAYLLGDETGCLLDDSIYIRINVEPN